MKKSGDQKNKNKKPPTHSKTSVTVSSSNADDKSGSLYTQLKYHQVTMNYKLVNYSARNCKKIFPSKILTSIAAAGTKANTQQIQPINRRQTPSPLVTDLRKKWVHKFAKTSDESFATREWEACDESVDLQDEAVFGEECDESEAD